MATIVQAIRTKSRVSELKDYAYLITRSTTTDFYRSRIALQTIYNYTSFSTVLNLALHNDLDKITNVKYLTSCPGKLSSLRAALLLPSETSKEVPAQIYMHLYNCANDSSDYEYFKEVTQVTDYISPAKIIKTTFVRTDGSEAEAECIIHVSFNHVYCITSMYNAELADKLMSIMVDEYLKSYSYVQDEEYLNIIAQLWDATLHNSSCEEIVQSLDAYFETHYLQAKREAAIRKFREKLTSFSKTKLDISATHVTKIRNTESKIADYEHRLHALYNELAALRMQYYKATLDMQDDTITNFTRMLQNLADKGVLQNIHFNVNNAMLKTINFVIETPITYWEEDEAKAYMKYLETRLSSRLRKYIFEKIFINKEIVIHTRTGITFNLDNYTVTVYPADTPDVAFKHPYDLMIHPHVGWYYCFGDNKASIIKCLGTNDLAGALGYAMSSLTQMNLADYVVTDTLLDNLTGSNSRDYGPWYRKCLEYKGAMLTGESLVAVLKTELDGGEPVSNTDNTTRSISF